MSMATTMAKDAAIAPIGKFDLNKRDWASYQEHLEQYFIVNNIKGADDEASASDTRRGCILA